MIVEKEEDKNSFYKSIRWVLVFGQICGLIPVRGIYGPNHKRLRFTWKNPVLLYILYLTAVTAFFGCVVANEVFKNDIKLDGFAPTAFYLTCLAAFLMFFNLARKFPEIASDFYELEQKMSECPKHLGMKMKIFIVVYGGLAVAEHGSMIVLNIKYAKHWAKTVEDIGFGQAFFRCMMKEVSEVVPYSPIVVTGLVWTNVMCTLTWNYIDFFLIAISIQLSSRLKLINARVLKVDVKKENRMVWQKILEDYNQTSLLIKKLDHILSKFILISLVNDFYHLSLQLLRSIKVEGGTFQKIYFYFSMFYLIGRLLTLAYCMSRIEDEGKKSIDPLYGLNVACAESNRLLHQILTDDVYFTGNRLFVINRTFVITVIGTLITYQVILLQVESLHFYNEKV